MKYNYGKSPITITKDESGMTLVEVLASIVLISLIVTTFLSFFIQASKTNNQTKDVNFATFIAQAELEELNQYTKIEDIDLDENGEIVKTSPENDFTIRVKITKLPDINLYNAFVTVRKGEKTYAQMETYLTLEKQDAGD
ncbi:type IV pilus modification PilV family protein [Jeotgalibaca ciconiae]|uniref:Type II secretion system protein n=1 Tax=Jeotgalibaca ciconiae TaxID=2496265 RepID=A0A3S9H8I2_9LACT|nr:type II secretion system protein [Jeotgalibaca ciconiae]AZP03679.1 type II secretion system protein [Jeotgalibaca ciconiae]